MDTHTHIYIYIYIYTVMANLTPEELEGER